MASLRLTIRLKTSDESEAWRIAAESQGYSTLNKFIRTVVNKSILDLNANRDEVEQRNRKRIDELERLFIDLIEGNFASDPGGVAFTELQRKMKGCLDEDGRIVVRWLDYEETPTNPYGDGVWNVIENQS